MLGRPTQESAFNYCFWRKGKWFKSSQNMQTLFTLEYLSYFIHLHIAYEHIHVTPGSCASVKYTHLLVKFCLIV